MDENITTQPTTANNDATVANPANEGETQGTQQTTPTTATEGGDFDITSFEIEPGVPDWNKVKDIVHEKERFAKSASYYQSQYMKKNDVPENIEGYKKDFKADSSYENFMDNDVFKELEKNVFNWAFKNGIGRNAAQSFLNFVAQDAVNGGIIDTRSEEQKTSDEKKFQEDLTEKLNPYLHSVGKSRAENDMELKNFIEGGHNPFATNDTIKSMMHSLMRSPEGYTFLSEVMNFFGNRGIPSNTQVITGTTSQHDIGALYDKLATASGEEADRLLEEFYGNQNNKYTPQ